MQANESSVGRIAVVGAGAVGCYYGGLLARNGCDVRFLMRSDLESVRKNGLTIRTRGEKLHIQDVNAFGSAAEIGPSDLVIIALKATTNSALEQLIQPLIHAETILLTLQNGLGNEEFLATRWGPSRVLGGLCFVCLNRTSPGVIEHYDHGSISIGEYGRPVQARTERIVQALQQSGIEARAVDQLMTERWRKLLWNIPFNGLAIATGGSTVADILADDGLRVLARDLMSEALDAARRLGHDIPNDFADFQIERSWSMGPYKPSSLIDWELGRPVEVEAIWGEPWRQAVSAGADVPRLETLYRILQSVTKPR